MHIYTADKHLTYIPTKRHLNIIIRHACGNISTQATTRQLMHTHTHGCSVTGHNNIQVFLSLSSLCVPCLLQAPPPLTDPLPNCPNYRTSCSFILKRTDMSLTELYTDLLQNVSDTNPLPAPDIHTLVPAGVLQT